MNNQKNLYIVITALVITNVATISYLVGANRFNSFMGFGVMGGNHMMDKEYWKEHDGLDNWEEMVEHMEEEHGETSMRHSEVDYNKPVVETHKKTYDFGKISKADGVKSTTFEIENHGKQSLEIGEISTSCQCISAEIDKTSLGFNEEAELTVYFDPNVHEEPGGGFSRSVFVKTNDTDLPEMQFDIFVEILD